MIASFGAKDVVVEELIALEPSMVREMGTVYGLVLLFKWTQGVAAIPRHVVPDAKVYFAKQLVHNACATQAIINTLLNQRGTVDLGPELDNFLTFTEEMPPQLRGEMIGQSDVMRNVHNSFARPSMFSIEDKLRSKEEEEEAYHFVTFLYRDGSVWELDGLREGPILVAPAAADNWIDVACEKLSERLEELGRLDTSGSGQGISFSLMAVVKDRMPELLARRAAAGDDGAQAAQVAQEIADLEEMRANGKAENARRRHNYIPTIIALLRALKDKGQLQPLIEEATQKAADRLAKRAAKSKAK
jgi:ubiquitin carboxyl-terminal hydrolase L5